MGMRNERIERFIRFEVTIPRTYNPPEYGVTRREIPPELINDIRRAIRRRFGGCKSWIGGGDSVDPETGEEFEEPERYFRINVKLEDAADAWNWFAQKCPQWASKLKQWAIYLELPEQGLAYQFPSAEGPQPNYTNPFLPTKVSSQDILVWHVWKPRHFNN